MLASYSSPCLQSSHHRCPSKYTSISTPASASQLAKSQLANHLADPWIILTLNVALDCGVVSRTLQLPLTRRRHLSHQEGRYPVSRVIENKADFGRRADSDPAFANSGSASRDVIAWPDLGHLESLRLRVYSCFAPNRKVAVSASDEWLTKKIALNEKVSLSVFD